MSEPTPLDIGRIVEALDRHGVEYLLVGGVAAAAHGAERLTANADTVVRRTTENLEATAAVLREINAYLLVEGLSDEEGPGTTGTDRRPHLDQDGDLDLADRCRRPRHSRRTSCPGRAPAEL